ncbi:MAG: cupin domain-containing protein [Pedobacter sp.]|nr:MAG: cupin domain-containing protein [Pedobacter sp.]
MGNWQELIDSGLLELYVLGQVNAEEALFVEKMALAHSQVKWELEEIGLAMERYAQANAVEPDAIVKPFLMATIDFSDRLKSGEKPELAPILDNNSVAGDYMHWLERPDMVLPVDHDDVFAKILSYTPEAITAVVWIKHMAPQEVHDHEYERFLILEGTCDIYVEDQINQLKPGDYFQIPLHKRHHVLVTSEFPCKVILQRIAA